MCSYRHKFTDKCAEIVNNIIHNYVSHKSLEVHGKTVGLDGSADTDF